MQKISKILQKNPRLDRDPNIYTRYFLKSPLKRVSWGLFPSAPAPSSPTTELRSSSGSPFTLPRRFRPASSPPTRLSSAIASPGHVGGHAQESWASSLGGPSRTPAAKPRMASSSPPPASSHVVRPYVLLLIPLCTAPTFWLFVLIPSSGTCILAPNQSMVKILAISFWHPTNCYSCPRFGK